VLIRLQQELRDLQNQIDDLNEEIAAANAKVKVLEEETKTYKATIKAQATEIKQLEEKLGEEKAVAQIQKTELEEKIAAQATEIARLIKDKEIADKFEWHRKNPLTGSSVAKGPVKAGRPGNFTETINGVSFTMIYVEGGEFRMGDTFGEGREDQLPVHQVTLDGYYLGETVVTQGLYRAVMDQNPSNFKLSDEHPVETVSWEDAQAFIQKLNQLTGKRYALPTEAQWEFAARERGRQVRFGNGQNILRSSEANFDARKEHKQPYSEVGEYRGKTTSVKTFAPNALGLYDMAGNVLEWCQDGYDEKFYDTSAARARNPVNLKEGAPRVYRGGGWPALALLCRAAFRDHGGPRDQSADLGFRLASV
jgi:formylglycine-generating enzyme required for sulfatase activity